MTETLSLNTRKRTALRSQAHQLKPVVIIGKEGITENVIVSINNAFNTREMLKVKVLENAPETTKGCVDIILSDERMQETLLVQLMGRIITLYRKNDKIFKSSRKKNKNS